MYQLFAALFLFGTVLMVGFFLFLGFLEWRDNREPKAEPVAKPGAVPVKPVNTTT